MQRLKKNAQILQEILTLYDFSAQVGEFFKCQWYLLIRNVLVIISLGGHSHNICFHCSYTYCINFVQKNIKNSIKYL